MSGGKLTNWIPIFQAGTRRGEPYTPRDLDDIARNFRTWKGTVDPPAVIGHSEEQQLLKDTGLPAAGWVADLRHDGKGTLLARFSDMPPAVEKVIRLGAYRKVSAEIYHEDDPPEGVPCKGKLLRRVAFLGGELPQVKTLGDVARLWEQFCEPFASSPAVVLRYSSQTKLPHGGHAVFSEVRTMADEKDDTGGGEGDTSAVEDIAHAAIMASFPGLPEELIQSLTPEQMAMIAPAVGGDAAAEGTPADEPPPAMAEWPAGVTRESAIADLVAMGEDQAALEAMSDDELIALWQQKQGGAAQPPAAAPMSEKQSAAVARQYAEIQKGYNRLFADYAAMKREAEAARKERDAERKATRSRTVAAHCETWLRDGYVLPRDVDRGSKVPNLYHRLMSADASRVRKFGEAAMTEFESIVAEIEARGPGYVRYFSEKVAQPEKGGYLDQVEQDATAYAEKRNKLRAKSA